MYNLYAMPAPSALAASLASAGFATPWLDLPPHPTDATEVRPFGTGLFLRPEGASLLGVMGQWGMIRPGQRSRIDVVMGRALPGGKPPAPRARTTHHAQIEGIATKPTFAHAWQAAQRCLIPALWYAEPHGQEGETVWQRQQRADGQPWFLAGLWSQWREPRSCTLLPNFTMITCEPAQQPTGHEKRALVHIEPVHWAQWLHGSEAEALALVRPV